MNFFFLGGPMNSEEKELADDILEDGEFLSLTTEKWPGCLFVRSAYQRCGNKMIFDEAMSWKHSAQVRPTPPPLPTDPPPFPPEERRIITDDFI